MMSRSYVKMESTSGGKMMKNWKKKWSRSMDLSHVQIISSPHTNNNSQQSNHDDVDDDDDDDRTIIKENMIAVKNEEEGGKFITSSSSSESRRSNAAVGSEVLRFQKNANTRVKGEFSGRRHSTSERYCRVHDQNDHMSLEEDEQAEEDEEESLRKKKIVDKTSRGKFLNVCKRFLRL